MILRPLVEGDLPMLQEWLSREHVREWWGGDDASPTLDEVRAKYLPRIGSRVDVVPLIAMSDDEPVGFAQWYVALGAGDGWWEQETDPGVRGIDQFLCDGDRLGQGLGTRLVKCLVEELFRDPSVTRVQTDPSPRNARAIRCYEKAGFRAVGTIHTPDGEALYMVIDRPGND